MRIQVRYGYKEKFLPTKRHRGIRERVISDIAEAEIAEADEKDFPVAFIVQEYDWDENREFRMCDKEIRCFDNRLWSAVKAGDKCFGAPGWWQPERIAADIEYRMRNRSYPAADEPITDASVAIENNRDERIAELKEMAGEYVVFNGKVWEPCGEPMYCITTFGTNRNPEGTCLVITERCSPGIGRDRYFNALQREEAVAFGKAVAEQRGDTGSISRMGEDCYIKVLMPELVKRDPQGERENGNRP